MKMTWAEAAAAAARQHRDYFIEAIREMVAQKKAANSSGDREGKND